MKQGKPIVVGNRTRWLALSVFIVLATFAGSLEYGFVSDDNAFFVKNTNLLSQPVADYFKKGVWEFSSAADIAKGQLYRPFALLNYRAQAELWGDNPFGFHLTTVLVHALVTVLVFYLLSFLIPSANGRALALATLLFAVHPAQVEAVCWILGNNDVWAALWLFSGILLVVHSHAKNRFYMPVAAMLAILAAMLTKEVAYTVPGLLAIVCLIREEIIGKRQTAKLTLLSGTLLVLVFFLRRNAVAAPELVFDVTGFKKLFIYFFGYLKMTLLPLPQRFYLEEPMGGMVALWELLLGIAVFLGFGLLVLKVKEGRRFFMLSAGWYGLVLAPALVVAFHAVRSTFAARVLYIAIVSLSMIALWLMTHGSEMRRRCIERVVLALVVIYTATAVWMGSAWKDQESFYQMGFASTPDNVDLYVSKGDYYAEIGNVNEAIEAYKIAVSKTGNDKTKIRIHMSLGEIYAKEKIYDKALQEFHAVLAIEPNNAGAIIGLGNVYWLADEFLSAESYYKRVLLFDPDHPIAKQNLDAVREILSAQ
jgi:hypothetical protein